MTATTKQHLEHLVGFDTISDRSNSDLIDYAASVLRDNGVEPVLIPDPTGEKIGLHATIGPLEPGGVALTGHSDVVPVAGQNWSHDPFSLVDRDGRLHGRGASDMKGFLAACLAMVPEMRRADLCRPIHIVFSYDEETTCEGVLPVIEDMVARLPPIDAVIVGEPTSMQIVNAHKGAYGYKVAVTGQQAHSSLADQGASANALASRLVVWLDDQMRVNANAASAGDFTPNYTTCHAGTIRGGTACNILAGHCDFECDLRTLPGDDPQVFLQRFADAAELFLSQVRVSAPECRVTIERDYAVPGLAPEKHGAAEALCRRLTGQNRSQTVSYSSEGGQFQAAGLSTVLLGPGSIEQAHIADEYIEKSQLAECEAFLGKLIEAQAA